MKLFVLIGLLAVSQSAFARTCLEGSEREYSFEPETICVERGSKNGQTLTLEISGIPYAPPTVTLHILGENGEGILASGRIIDQRGGACESHYVVDLSVIIDQGEQGNIDQIHEATVTYERSPDTCHSPVRRKTLYF